MVVEFEDAERVFFFRKWIMYVYERYNSIRLPDNFANKILYFISHSNIERK